jgi:hypothetical protein
VPVEAYETAEHVCVHVSNGTVAEKVNSFIALDPGDDAWRYGDKDVNVVICTAE